MKAKLLKKLSLLGALKKLSLLGALKKLSLLGASSLIISSVLFLNDASAAGSSGGQVAFHLPILYRTRQVVLSTSGQRTNDQFLDGVPALGWDFSDLFFLGAAYHFTNETGTGDYKLSGGDYGPTVSLTASNFSLGLTYYLNGTLTEHSGGSDTVYSKGTGFGASLTYLFPVNANFAWGPSFIYTDIKYTMTQYGSAAAVSNTFELSGTEPYLALYFYF
jgi:hypothetical protein